MLETITLPPYINCYPPLVSIAGHYVASKVKAPLELALSSALITMAYSTQDLIDVQSDNRKPHPVTINIIGIAESGEGKSSVDNLFLNPIFKKQSDLEEEYENDLLNYSSAIDLWNIKNDALKKLYSKAVIDNKGNDILEEIEIRLEENKKSKPKTPKKQTLIMENITTAAFLDELANNSPSVLLSSNEGGTMVSGGIFNASAYLNKIWDAQRIDIGRKSVPSYKIEDIRVSISLKIQNGVFDKLLDKYGEQLRSSGFLARTFIYTPKSTQGSRFKYINHDRNRLTQMFDETGKHVYEDFIARTGFLIEQSISRRKNNEERMIVTFSPEAQHKWIQYHNWVENQLNLNGIFYNFKDLGSRHMEQISRVAAIFQFFSNGDLIVDERNMSYAINMVQWYSSQFINILSKHEDLPEYFKNSNELMQWIQQNSFKYGGFIPKNSIRQYGPNCIRNRLKLNDALDNLAMNGYVNIFKINKKIYISIRHI